jgi:hypothetical protein
MPINDPFGFNFAGIGLGAYGGNFMGSPNFDGANQASDEQLAMLQDMMRLQTAQAQMEQLQGLQQFQNPYFNQYANQPKYQNPRQPVAPPAVKAEPIDETVVPLDLEAVGEIKKPKEESVELEF